MSKCASAVQVCHPWGKKEGRRDRKHGPRFLAGILQPGKKKKKTLCVKRETEGKIWGARFAPKDHAS